MEDLIIKIFFIIYAIFSILLITIYLKFMYKIYLIIRRYINKIIINKLLKKFLPSFIMVTITSLVASMPLILILQTYLLYNQNKLIYSQTTLMKKQNEKNSKSNIKITILPFNSLTDTIILKKLNNKHSYEYNIKYKVILSNIGFKAVSILNYYVYMTSDLDKKMRINAFLLRPKLLSFNNDNFYLPVNLEAGKSVGFVLQLTKQLMKKDYEKIKDKLVQGIGTTPMILLSVLDNIQESAFNTKLIISFEKLNGKEIAIDIPNKIEIKYNKENNL